MNYNIKLNVFLILLGIQSACCFLLDTSSVSGHDGGWSDWRCEQTEDNCFKIRTCNSTIDFNCPKSSEVVITTCPCDTEWSSWGKWTCTQSGNICMHIRHRSCIGGFADKTCSTLPEKDFETVPCANNITCTFTDATPTNQVVSTSSNSITASTQIPFVITTFIAGSAIQLSTSPTATKKLAALSNSFTTTTSNSSSSISTLASARFISSTASVYLTSQTAYVTNPASSYPLSTSKTSVVPSNAYIYWLEWTGWECKNLSFSFCLMSRTRNCSTYYPEDCEKKLGGDHFHVEPCKNEICPANWSEWSNWTCRVEKDGSCNKTRSRKCSTGSDAQCGSDTFQREPCDDVTCPELNELGRLGYCKNVDSSSCLDADTCKNPSILLMCLADAHVASKICPKTCGCCHVDSKWSRWSDWRCERTKTMCRMKQSRTCSTGNTADCVGISVREAVCDESLCPEPTWDSWSGWKCQLRPNNTCIMSRYRTCSTGTLCIGQSHEEDVCSSAGCPDFVDFKVDCSLYNTKSDACVDGAGCQYFENTPKTLCVDDAATCPVTCGCCTTQLSTQKQISTTSPTATKKLAALSNPYTATTSFSSSSISTLASARFISSTAPIYVTSHVTNPASSYPLSTSNTSVVPFTPYIYWLEWTGWECKNVIICLMSRTRNCSTYNPDDCEKKLGGEHFHVEPCKKEICPVNWSEWSNWTCGIEKDGSCRKTRSRKCSTGADAQCGLDSLERKPCDNVTCPELNELGHLGYCKRTDSSYCSDAETCKNPSIQLICLVDAHVASMICPKTCGCCHVDPEWSRWSDWRCERTKTMCRMKQNRTCSTGNTTDCEGISVREAVCDESLCPEPSWDSWSDWKCQLRPNNTCIMSRSRKCSNRDFCIGDTQEEDVCSSAMCPDFVGYKIDCSLHNTKSDACVDGAGCHFFENSPKSLCIDDAATCPVTCGCCIPYILLGGTTTQHPSASSGNGSGVTTNSQIGVTTQKPPGSGGNSSNGTGTEVTTNNPIGVTTQNLPGSGGNGANGTGSVITTNNQIGVTTQNPSGSGGNGSNGTGFGVTTNNTIDFTTRNLSGSGGNYSNVTGSGVTTNYPIGVTSQNPSGSSGYGANGTGIGFTTNNPIGVTTQNPSGSGGNGSNKTSSGVTTNNPISVTTQNSSGSSGKGANGTGSGVTINYPIGVSTQNPSGSGGNGSNGTGSRVTTNNPIGVTTQNPSGSGGNGADGTGPGITTNIPIGVITQNPFGFGGNGSNGTSSRVTTNNPIGVTTQIFSGSSGNGANGTDSGVATNNPIGVPTQNQSGSGGNGSNGTGSGVTTNNPIGVTTQNSSGSGGHGLNGTGSGVTTNNPIGFTTQNPSGSGGNGSNGISFGVTTNNPIGVTTQNSSGSSGNGANGTGSEVTTNNPFGVITQNSSGPGGNYINGTGSGVTTNNPIGVITQNPSGSGGNGTGVGVTTNNTIGFTTQNPPESAGNDSNGTGFGVTTNYPIGQTSQNPSGSSGNGANGTGIEFTTNNPIGLTSQNPSGSGGNDLNGTVSGVTTNNTISFTTQNPSGSGGNGANETGSGITTNNPIGMTTQNPSGSGGNGLNGTSFGVTTNNPIGVTTQNSSGSSGNGANGTGSGVTTNNPIGVTTQNPSGSGGNGSNETSSGVTTNNPIEVTTQSPSLSGGNGYIGTGLVNVTNSTSHTVAPTPSPIITSPSRIKTITTTQKQPHTPTPTAGTSITTHVASAATTGITTATTQAVKTASTEATTATATTQNLPHTSPPVPVICNVCSGPEFLCEKLFAPQTCSPPNNYCINKLSNHRDGTRTVTRNCGNFDTCYRDWFIASSDSDRCRIFDENSVITLEFDCTYCCTSDNCNKPIKPLDKYLYKNIE